MREILFRGKRTDNGEWVEGFYFKKPNPTSKDGLPIYYGISDLPPFGAEVLPETVGQYIGQPDKNSVKIFEGDILKAKVRCGQYYRNKIGYVVFDKYGLKYELKIRKKEIHEYKLIPNQTDCEVIGNIYDNPELLETPAYTEVIE